MLGALGRNVIETDGEPMARGLAQPRVARDNSGEHLRVEMVTHIDRHLVAEPCPGVEHGQQKSLDDQGGVQPFLYQLEGVQEALDPFEGIVFALNRNEERVGRGKCVEGEKAKRGRAVYDQKVEGRYEAADGIGNDSFSHGDVHELHVCPDQIGMARSEGKPTDLRYGDNGIEGLLAQHDVVHVSLKGRRIETEPCRGIGLRVQVYDERLLSQECERGAQIYGGRSLSDTTLLIGNTDYPARHNRELP